MTVEKIIIIMLLYILACVVVYFLSVRYIIDRNRKKRADTDGGKSLIDGLEIDQNIFDVPRSKDGIDTYEIDSPYKKTTVDDVVHGPDKKDGPSRIRNKIRGLLE